LNWLTKSSARALLALLAMSWLAAPAHAEDGDPREAELKAAYIFNFLKFVEWGRAVPADTIEVCFRGAAAIRDAFATSVTNKQIGSRQLLVKVLGSKDRSDTCQVLFVDSANLDAVPARAQVLTIGDDVGFTRHGGIIGLYTESNRLRFNVNVGNAKRSGLQVSSNLLKLAAAVEQSPTL
jgi:hypothetical protein